jgi:hypothetical protein
MDAARARPDMAPVSEAAEGMAVELSAPLEGAPVAAVLEDSMAAAEPVEEEEEAAERTNNPSSATERAKERV